MINPNTSSLQKSPEYAGSSKNECCLGKTDDNGKFDIFQQLEKNVFNKSAFCLSVLASVSPCTNVGIQLESELESDYLLTSPITLICVIIISERYLMPLNSRTVI